MDAITPIFISSLTTAPDFIDINSAKSATLISSGTPTSITFLSTGFLNTCLLSTLSTEERPDFRRGPLDLSSDPSSSTTRGFFLELLREGFLAVFLPILSSSSSETGLACRRPFSGADCSVASSFAGLAGLTAGFCVASCSATTAASAAFFAS